MVKSDPSGIPLRSSIRDINIYSVQTIPLGRKSALKGCPSPPRSLLAALKQTVCGARTHSVHCRLADRHPVGKQTPLHNAS
jgi:hypothetical protein